LCAASEVLRVELDALPQLSVAAIVSEMLALTDAPTSLVRFLAQESEGNPFFVCEFLRLALETDVLRRDARGRWQLTQPGLGEQSAYESLPVPQSIRDLAARRLAGLGELARSALDAAAVLGKEFDLDLLDAVAALGERARLDALTELVHRQILKPTEARRLRFAHDKIREAAYDQIPAPRREALHRLAAEQLEGGLASDLDAERSSAALAHHWLASGDERKALVHLERAGEWSLRSGAHQEARTLLSHAVEIGHRLQGAVTPAQRARHLRLLGEASASMGDLASSVTHTLAAYSTLGGWVPASPAAYLIALIGAAFQQVSHRLAVRRPSESKQETAAQLAISARDAATTYYFQSDIVRSVTNSLRCINLAERSGQTALAPLAYAQVGYIAGALRMHPVARTYFRLARSVPREAAHSSVFAAGTYFFAMYEMGLGHWKASQVLGEEALALLEEIDNTQEAEIARTIVANTLYFWGRFRDSERRCREMLAFAERRGNAQHTGWGLFLTGRSLLAMGGDLEGALRLIERGHHYLRQLPDFVSTIMCDGLLAKALWAAGECERSLEIVDSLAGRLRDHGVVPLAQCLDAYEAVASVCLDRWEQDPRPSARDAALRACASLRRFAWMFPIAKPTALRASARAAELLGSEARARRLWKASLEQAVALDMKYEEACCHLGLARSAGAPELQEHHANEAARLLGGLGCIPSRAADLRRAS
jgi:tetratricopeptide (TPR) repeat protein